MGVRRGGGGRHPLVCLGCLHCVLILACGWAGVSCRSARGVPGRPAGGPTTPGMSCVGMDAVLLVFYFLFFVCWLTLPLMADDVGNASSAWAAG